MLPNQKSLQMTISNLTKTVENSPNGKRKNCSLQAISPFPTMFSKENVLQTRKKQGFLGQELMHLQKVSTHAVKSIQADMG